MVSAFPFSSFIQREAAASRGRVILPLMLKLFRKLNLAARARVFSATLAISWGVAATAAGQQTATEQVPPTKLKLLDQKVVSDPFLHYHLAVGLYNEGKLDSAAAEFRAALALNPGLAEVHNNLGVILDRQGKHADAIGEFRSAVRVNPRYLEARYNLAAALLEAGRAKEAEDLARAGLAQSPDCRGDNMR